jgi:signal transduction histidine kinase
MILPTIKTHSSLAPQLAEVGKKIGRLAEEIHRTSRQLHPAVLNELGLETALQEECETLSEHSGMRVRLTSTNLPAALPEDVSLSLYRVAQESLYNIRKHAGATEVNVRLEGTADGVSLQVADSGDGFDVEETRKRGGLGLISMEERVRLIGGKFSILSHTGNGTQVEVFVPLNLSET